MVCVQYPPPLPEKIGEEANFFSGDGEGAAVYTGYNYNILLDFVLVNQFW